MASRTGMFLKQEARVELIQELKNKGELKPGEVPEDVLRCAAALDPAPEAPFGTGCLTCGEDDDHANLLLCEACNDEYHTYCLDPPLRSVPATDWFCDRCKMPFEDDGLDKLISALPPKWTSRLGEVCWAQGGVGFGWWPAFIYDPRFTVGTARQLARKNLGKRHLVYFFECHDAPFAVLPDSKISKWDEGLIDDHHLGKAARASGKARTKAFQQALQAASVEAGKPVEMRMNWNHNEQPQILPSPKMTHRPKNTKGRKRSRDEASPKHESGEQKQQSSSSKPGRNKNRPDTMSGGKRRSNRGFELLSVAEVSESIQPQLSTRRNLNKAIAAVAANNANQIESSEEDGDLFCKLFQKCEKLSPNVATTPSPATIIEMANIGFVKLVSKKRSTFADARKAIYEQLVPDCFDREKEWKFYVPNLGPVSSKQEQSLGPMFQFLRKTTADVNLGNGSLINPLKVIIISSSLNDGINS